MSNITETISHLSEMLNLLPAQFVEKPVIEGLLTTWINKSQEIEQELFDIEKENYFLVAEGSQLDRYGVLLESPRIKGQTDEDFRFRLVEQIMKRSTDGTPDKIRKIIEATTNISNTRYFEHYIGSVFIYGEVPFDFNVESIENNKIANIVKAGSPVTSTGCVLGVVRNTSSLWIPSEILISLTDLKVVITDPDDNVLGDQLGNTIALKVPNFEGFIYSENGLLAEAGGASEQFVVDSPTDEDFLVSPPSEGQPFLVEIIGDFPYRNDHGICLETNQFNEGDTL